MSTSHHNRSSTVFSLSTMPSTATMGTGSNATLNSSTNTSTSMGSICGGGTSSSGQQQQQLPDKSAVVLQGSLKKLKTMKKKFFVLYRDGKDDLARLEYYDSEKKFKQRSSQPKRKIFLKDSAIVRRLDTKHKYVIAFKTVDDCFSIVLESEADLNKWLRASLQIQRGEEITEEPPRSFEHIWQVHVQRKGLAEEKGIIGNYNVCLTERKLSLVRVGSAVTLAGEQRMASVEFLLMTIRRCGNTQIYFYLEVGRHSCIGSGELWMETDDALIAENMHTLIFNAMTESSKARDDGFGPISRGRSSSDTASSKPIPMLQRRQTHTGNKILNVSLSPTGESPPASTSTTTTSSSTSTLVQTPKTPDPNYQPDLGHHVLSASTTTTAIINPGITRTSCNPQYPTTLPYRLLGSQRRHSVSVAPTAVCHQRAFSLPSGSNSISLGPQIVNNQSSSSNLLQNHHHHQQQYNHHHLNNLLINSTHGATIQPFHQRTRSLPLTEETAIQLTTIASLKNNVNNNNNNNYTAPTIGPPIINSRCTCHLLNKQQSPHHHHHQQQQHHTNCMSSLLLSSSSSSSSSTTTHLNNNKSSGHLYNNTILNNNNNHINNNLNMVELNNNIRSGCGIGPMIASLIKPSTSSSSSSSFSANNHHHHIANSMDSIIEDHHDLCDNATDNDQTDHTNDEDDDDNNDHHDYVNNCDIDEHNTSLSNINHNQFNNSNSNSNNNIVVRTNNHLANVVVVNNNNNNNSNMNVSTGGNSGGCKTAIGNKTSPSTMRRCRNSSTTSWSTMVRDRCDSMPSRNRTASESSNQSIQSAMMPPPRSVLGNRPHSMYYSNRYCSYSPPVNSPYPFSPSGACSESDGSSFSIDETDGLMHSSTADDNVSRYMSSLPPGPAIPEENPDDILYTDTNRIQIYEKMGKSNTSLSLPISQSQSFSQRKGGSPAPRVGSIEGSNYMDMYSPCGSSPGDQANTGYIPMSPGVDFARGMYTSSSGAHSRASSLAEETIDGYVPMCPQQTEYVDMEPSLHHRQHHHHHHHHPSNSMSSAASSCSITSGTPSTDLRFVDYHLDKVIARFTPDDEDTSSITERPTRAYSVGSKMEHNKRKFRVDMLNTEQQMNSRVRAFSVGSRAKVPRSDYNRGVLTPAQAAMMNAHENAVGGGVGKGKKSSSAPMLNIKGHSVDPMENLMEIDYSRKDEATPVSNEQLYVSMESNMLSGGGGSGGGGILKTEQTMTPRNPTMTDLMEIDYSQSRPDKSCNTPVKSSLPVPVPNSRRQYDISKQHIDISPKMGAKVGGHMADYVNYDPHMHASDPIVCSGGSGGRSSTHNLKNNDEDGYLDMRPGAHSAFGKSPSLSSSPNKSISSPKTVPHSSTSFSSSRSSSLNKNSNYMDLSSRSLDKIQNIAHDDKTIASSPKTGSDDYLNMRPGDLPKTVSAPEGYMQMSWSGKSTKNFNNNTITEKPSSDEYINMNFSHSPEQRLTSSLPIAIQGRNKFGHNGPSVSTPKNQSQTQIYSTFSPRTSTPTSSSPGKPNRTRWDSKDSGIVTPSGSQAAMFPFSPSSPHKNMDKCLVDGTTGTLKLTEEDESGETSPITMTSSTTTPSSTPQTPQAIDKSLPMIHPKAVTPNLDTLSNHYADMSLNGYQSTHANNLSVKRHIESPDYVNCSPFGSNGSSKPVSPCTTPLAADDGAGDYVIVDPTKKNSYPTPTHHKQTPHILNSNEEKIPTKFFRPITSTTDESLMVGRNTSYINKSGSPKPAITSALNRQLTGNRLSDEGRDTTGYDVMQARNENKKFLLSRPNSVNSEKITAKISNSSSSLNHRPNSANSERVAFTSASSSSSSTLGGGSSSSSSTLCGSKSQSPSSSSSTPRPQSLSDIGIGRGGIGSRPESVTSFTDSSLMITSRPPSVSSERELNYASLDLPPVDETKLPTTPGASGKNPGDCLMMNCDPPLSQTPSPNPAANCAGGGQPAFTYTQIDFVKSDQMKAKQQQSTKSN